MAKLFTDHDPYNIHKLLGLLCLIHYIYRGLLLLRDGDAFPATESVVLQCVLVAAHGVLSVSSLLLPLPAKRNFSSPMIWPEFRLHSITFASRHVVLTIPTLLGWWPMQLYGMSIAPVLVETVIKTAAVIGVCQVANLVTQKYGSKELRTTNSMPYPSNYDDANKLRTKQYYAFMQFLATVSAVIPGEPWVNFIPIIAIQMAPLLMTLVRKNIVGPRVYHAVYTVSLEIGVLIWVAALVKAGKGPPLHLLVPGVLARVACALRMHQRWSTTAVWGTMIPITLVLSGPVLQNPDLVDYFNTPEVATVRYYIAVLFLANASKNMVRRLIPILQTEAKPSYLKPVEKDVIPVGDEQNQTIVKRR